MHEIALILLRHSGFVSVSLLRCNKSLASLLPQEETIQAIRRHVCRRISKEVARIPYFHDADACGYNLSMRKFKDRIWEATGSRDEKQLNMCTRFIVKNPLDPTEEVPIQRHSLTDEFHFIFSKKSCKYHDGFILPSYGWERGVDRYSRYSLADYRYYSTLGFDLKPIILSTEEMDIICTCCIPDERIRSGKRLEDIAAYVTKSRKRSEDMYYGDGSI